MNKFISEFRDYKTLLAWNRVHNTNIKARFAYCELSGKYITLIGDRVNRMCKACVTVTKNF